MTQIINITSEALQRTIRRLLPSQQGFGEDLQATNVITPIIDLTPTAEGSEIGQNLQTALAFGSSTEFDVSNTTSTLTSVAGFYQITGAYCVLQRNANVAIIINDGSTGKRVWEQKVQNTSGSDETFVFGNLDYTCFLRPGDSLKVSSDSSNGNIQGSFRQIADVNGNLVNPVGFTPQ